MITLARWMLFCSVVFFLIGGTLVMFFIALNISIDNLWIYNDPLFYLAHGFSFFVVFALQWRYHVFDDLVTRTELDSKT
jgi:hypothetical protein